MIRQTFIGSIPMTLLDLTTNTNLTTREYSHSPCLALLLGGEEARYFICQRARLRHELNGHQREPLATSLHLDTICTLYCFWLDVGFILGYLLGNEKRKGGIGRSENQAGSVQNFIYEK
jgi:hypothetical protein